MLRDLRGQDDVVRAVALSADGRWLACGSWDRTVHVYDARTATRACVLGEPPRRPRKRDDPPYKERDELLDGPLQRHGGTVRAVVLSADSAILVSGSCDATAKVWCLRTGASAPSRRERKLCPARTPRRPCRPVRRRSERGLHSRLTQRARTPTRRAAAHARRSHRHGRRARPHA